MKFDNLILVGVGGTGSHLLESLARQLVFHPNQTKNMMIIDGDKFEEKNQERQLFDKEFIGQNKVDALAKKVNFGGLEVVPVPAYINRIDFANIILGGIADVQDKMILIITAVDNHATRKDIITAVDEAKLKNFVVMMPGNELSHGSIKNYVKYEGKALTSPHPFDLYDDIKNPTDRIPGGCAAQTPSTPQLITANASAALACLLLVQAMLEDKPWYQEVHFNCEKMKMVPQGDPIYFKKPEPKKEEPKKEETVTVELAPEVKLAPVMVDGR